VEGFGAPGVGEWDGEGGDKWGGGAGGWGEEEVFAEVRRVARWVGTGYVGLGGGWSCRDWGWINDTQGVVVV